MSKRHDPLTAWRLALLAQSRSPTELLPQPHGFEGRISVREVLLPYRQPAPQGEDLEDGLSERGPAGAAMPRVATRGEQPVTEIDDLAELVPEVFYRVEHRLPGSEVAPMAAIHRRKIGRSEASNGELEFDVGVKEEEEKVEIPSIDGLTPLAHDARDDGTAQTGAWRQPRPCRNAYVDQRREPGEDPFIQSPPPGLARDDERRSHPANRVHVLPRHRRQYHATSAFA